MGKDSSLHEIKLNEILNSHRYEELGRYKDPKGWAKMTESEKSLLAKLFVMHGQALLREGEESAYRCFDLAVKVDPENPYNHFQRGVAYTIEGDIPSLQTACKAFEEALQREPDYFEALFEWALALVSIGEIESDVQLFLEADEKFLQAEKIYPESQEASISDFYWQWGHAWHLVGKLSGEAIDISKALVKYRKAEETGASSPEFWNDYGNALGEQACLLGQNSRFSEVVDKFSKAVDLDSEYFDSWFGLACSYMRLYEESLCEDDFSLADNSFEAASKLEPENVTLWLCWGQLYLIAGKQKRECDYLIESTTKFEEANRCEGGHPLVLCRWGEALMGLGALQEDIQYIQEAEGKIKESIEQLPSNGETWYFYGRVLVERGRYFGDVQFYFEAIEKYQYGFSLNRSLKYFHYGIALAFFELAELANDQDALKQSLKHFHELSQEQTPLPAQFWVDWGNALYRYGEETNQKHYVEAALSKYEESLSITGDDLRSDPLVISSLYHYGCALDTLGDMHDDPAFYERAIQLLHHIIQFDSDFLPARYNLALALAHLGELVSDIDCLEKAHNQFEILLSRDPEDENGWNDWGITLLNMANLLRDPSMPELSDRLYIQAEEKFHHAIALGSNQAYYNMAGYYSTIGNYSASLSFLQRAAQADALPPIDELMHDEWLDGVRQTEEFRQFIARCVRGL